jgi:hypothetical protein
VSPLVLGAIAVAVIGIGVVALRPGTAPADPAASPAPAASTPESAAPAAREAPVPPETIARAEAVAKFGPRKQAVLPPIPFQGYQPPRSHEVITAAYQFAAEHPEILSYVPCFCGCEHSGHDGNHDCFVKSRDEDGNVTEWDEHGVECAVCIDVAHRSRQMHASGATVRDIRAAIEKEFGKVYPGHTPTPPPPAASH